MRAIFDAITTFLGKRKHRTSTGAPGSGTSEIAILCLLSEGHDRTLVADTCRSHRWTVSFAMDLDDAQRQLARVEFPIVLLDRDLAGEKWREAMTRLVTPSGALCVLLVSKILDDYLWNEVVRNGGYDVLAKPLREADVSRAVRLTWSYWLSANRRGAAALRARPESTRSKD